MVENIESPLSRASLRFYSKLRMVIYWKDGRVLDCGVVSRHCVTDAFAELFVDTLQNVSGATIADFFYHDTGTGTTAEDHGDTTLQTPCGEARDAGTCEKGDTALIYQSVATHTYTTSGTLPISEHGIFNAAADGTLLDRSVFAERNVDPGDSIVFTYTLEVVAGG